MKSQARLIVGLKIWIAIYPPITVFLYLFGRRLSALQLYKRTFILTITIVPWIVFVAVPLVDSILLRIMTKMDRKLKDGLSNTRLY